jgi:subtilase family serine protease
MGITVLFASGDNGVAGLINACLNSDGSQSANGRLFNPSFPGTCPYVTSVGATQGTQFSFVSAWLFIDLLRLFSRRKFHRVPA